MHHPSLYIRQPPSQIEDGKLVKEFVVRFRNVDIKTSLPYSNSAKYGNSAAMALNRVFSVCVAYIETHLHARYIRIPSISIL